MGRTRVILIALFTSLFMSFPVFGDTLYGEYTVLSSIPLSGDGFSWDTNTLVLDNYDGGAFRFNNEASIILHGKNRISAGPNGAGLTGYKGLVIDGQGSGSLEITTKDALGIEVYRFLTIKDAGINIISRGDSIAYGIFVIGSSVEEENGTLLFHNVTGTVSAYADDPDIAAVYSAVPMSLEGTVADKPMGVFSDPEDTRYSFMEGEKLSFTDETAFDNARAETVNLLPDDGKRRRATNVIVKGEVFDLLKLFPSFDNTSIFSLKERKMRKIASVNGTSATGKRRGKAIIQIRNAEDKALDEKYLTVIRKPRLKFPKKVTFEENKTVDAYSYFKTPDTKDTAADSWESSDENVAVIDDNGIITLKGAGKTTVTAGFGNVRVSAVLKVR